MFKLKNKAIMRIAVFAIILTIVLWLLPAGFISAEDTAPKTIEELQQAVTDATTALADAQAAADAANAALAAAQTAADAANTALADAKAALDTANAALATAQAGGVAEDIAVAQASVDSAVSALADAQAAADAANAALAAAQTAADAANAALADAQTALDAANTALEEALNQEGGEDPVIEPPIEQPVGGVILNPVLSTDKEDYSPEETVIISGTGFAPNAVYTIQVIRPDGSIVIGDGSFTPGSDSVLTDASGNFTYNYILDGILGMYTVNAVDESGITIATTTFTDCSWIFKLRKYGEINGTAGWQSGEPWLQGAEFKLQRWEGGGWGGGWNTKQTKTTDSDGKLQFNPVGTGDYRIIESSAPSNYQGSYVSTTFHITGGDHTEDLGNIPNTPQLGKVTITKSGLEHGHSPDWRDEVKFILDGPNGLHYEQILDCTSGGNPDNVTWDNLPYGNYTLTESYDGLGNKYTYTSNFTSPTSFTVDSSHTLFTYNVVNCKLVGRVHIDKSGLEWGYWWRDYAIFTLTGPTGPDSQTRTVNLDNCWWTFDVDDDETWDNLPPGSYTLNESYPGDNDFDYTSNISFPVTFDITAGSTNHEFDVENCVARFGSIVVTKSGLMPGDLVKISLFKGATLIEDKLNVGNETVTFSNLVFGNDYTIVEAYASGNIYSYGVATQNPVNPINVANSTPVCVTLVNHPEKGSINIHKTGLEDGDTAVFSLTGPGGPYTDITVAEGETKGWPNLPYGSYTVTESTGGGNTWVYNTDLSSSPIDINGDNENPTINVTNTALKGSIEIFKTDQVTGLPLEGSTFELWKFSSPVLIDTIVLGPGSNGHHKWENLPYGHYQVKETVAPTGYLLRDPVDVIIDPAGTLNFVLLSEIADPRIPSQLRLTKTDSVTGLPVPGATYNIYDSGSNLVEIITTGPDGSVAVTLVNWGTYTVKEATAPAGYLLDPTTYTITFDANNTSITLNVKDTPAGGGGPPTLTVAGLTEGTIQVLAFTGMDPIIPISGGSAVIAGLAMLLATLRRRVNKREVRPDKG